MTKKIPDPFTDHEVVTSAEFRLKDKPMKRRFKLIDLENDFETYPDLIAIEKVAGKKNTLVVKAFVPKSRGNGTKVVVPEAGFELKDLEKKE